MYNVYCILTTASITTIAAGVEVSLTAGTDAEVLIQKTTNERVTTIR